MKPYKGWALAGLLSLGLAASVSAAQNYDQQNFNRNDRERQEDRWVRGRVAPQWDLITKQVVNFRDDRDRIDISDAGRQDGKFSRLMIRAEDAPVTVRRMFVVFENGDKLEVISERTRFDAESGGLVIDLPGGRRDVKSLDIDYFSTANQPGGKGTLLVYGSSRGGRDRAQASDDRRDERNDR
jgi:hypothetical protein